MSLLFDLDRTDHDSFIENVGLPTREEGGNEVFIPAPRDDEPPASTNTEVVIDIKDNRDTKRQTDLLNYKQQILTSLNTIDTIVNNRLSGVLSQEGFSSFLANSIVGIGNLVGHITNLLATTVLYGWRDFKRSELTEYSDSNRITMTRLYAANYYEITTLSVPVPQGMEGKYYPALLSLQNFFEITDMPRKAKFMYETIKNIRKDITVSKGHFESYVRDINRKFNTKNIYTAFEKTSSFFTTSKNMDNKQFKAVFDNMQEYEYTIKTCMSMDTELRQVSSVHSHMKDTESEINIIIDNKDKLDAEQVKGMADTIRMMAEIVDVYGTCLNDTRRMSNNLLWVTKRLRERLGM